MSRPVPRDELANLPGAAPLVPELGPSLGRLTDPPSARLDRVWLDQVRLDLVTRLFDQAGAARSAAAEGDPAGALGRLTRDGWLQAWEDAVGQLTDHLADGVNARLRSAAAESRLPRRRLEPLLLGEDDRRALAVRLGLAGADLVERLDLLAAAAAAEAADAAALTAWREAVLAAARRQESAWLELERLTAGEQAGWQREIAAVRGWRPARWPLWVITALVIAVLGYLGLVVGGYLDAPEWLRGFAAWWWSRT